MRVHILTTHFYYQLKEVEEYKLKKTGKEHPCKDRIIFGGAERYLVELAKLLMDCDCEVTVIQGHSGYPGEIRREYQDIKIISVPYENGDLANLNHIFNEYAIYSDLRIYFAPFLTWPTVRRPAIAINHGIFWDFSTHPLKQMNHIDRETFFKRQLHAASIPMVAVDTNVRNFYAAYEPGSEANIYVIPNFVDTKEFTPKIERTWERPRILYPRRLTSVRGINDFIYASSQFPEADFHICGNGLTGEMEQQLKMWTESIPNVFSVWHPMEEMAPIYRNVDISVVPTRAAEGTSLSALESMAAGLPIITTPVGGLANLVIDRYNGLVVDLNWENLCGAIRFLLDNPELWGIYGERNRKIAEEAFSLKLWRERWVKFLEKVI